MISGACWVRKGAAAINPERFQMTDEQYADIMSRAKFEIEEAKVELGNRVKKPREKKPKEETSVVDEELKQFNLDTYDDTGASDAMEEDFIQAMSNVDAAALGEDDDYLIEKDREVKGREEEEEEEDEEDKDDLTIRPADNLVIATRMEDEISYLEVYVYEEAEDNLYVHHDIMLPSFPLCVEWIGAGGLGSNGQAGATLGNYAAIGTFDPEIEIWNLDVLDTPYPSIILGQREPGAVTGGSKKGRKKSSIEAGRPCPDRHTDAVMSLAWNRLHSTMLLSGSADSTIKLWDMSQARALRSFDHHQDKVQTLQWNPSESSVLASAAYDKSVKSFDCRTPGTICHWPLLADPECLKWNPHQPNILTVSDEEGRVLAFDTRKGSESESLFLLQAHEKAVTSIDWNPAVPDCLLTVSADRSIKLWNVAGGSAGISCVVHRELDVGKAFAGSFSLDSPNLVCVAGSKGILSVVNLLNDQAVVRGFSKHSDQDQR